MSAPAPVTAYTLTLLARRHDHSLHGDCNGRYECGVCHWAVRHSVEVRQGKHARLESAQLALLFDDE